MEKENLINRDRFTFYKSYRDTYYQLPIKDRSEFIETIMSVYFLEKRVEDIEPSTDMLKLAFASIKHSLSASIHGLFDKVQIDYNSYPWEEEFKGVHKGVHKGVSNNKQRTISNKQQSTSNIEYSYEFEENWKIYPVNRREDKQKCYEYFNQIPKPKIDVFTNNLKAYISNNEKENYKYVKKSHRYFKDWATIVDTEVVVIDKPKTRYEIELEKINDRYAIYEDIK